MATVSAIFTSAIVAAAVSVIPAFLSRKTANIKAKSLESGEKYIELSKYLFWFVYTASTLFIVLGALVCLFTDEPITGVGFIFMGFVFFLPMAILQSIDTSINWTSEYINGAKSGSSLKKNKILWKDISLAKLHPNYTLQLKDKSGKSVVWSIYHSGWREIIDDLRLIRPDIEIGDFD
ncbi:hypothetical protein [Hellea balneolensis]|uniref:hypothetical protein n=1 Tax=Hellea balneolensis TaxID=287478 RepID=UPI00047C4D13|nr:hypothetical protein [Hellea balneolensis]